MVAGGDRLSRCRSDSCYPGCPTTDGLDMSVADSKGPVLISGRRQPGSRGPATRL